MPRKNPMITTPKDANISISPDSPILSANPRSANPKMIITILQTFDFI